MTRSVGTCVLLSLVCGCLVAGPAAAGGDAAPAASATRPHATTAPASEAHARRDDGARPFAPELEWSSGTFASPAFTPDGKTVLFTHYVEASGNLGARRTIMISHLRDGAWTTPEVAPFSGRWRDIEPAMAPDGSYLVFVSNRPATPDGKVLDAHFGGAERPGAGGNIWRVERKGDGWGEPIRLPSIVNSHSEIYSPAVARDGSLYFSQTDPVTKTFHIYRAQRRGDGFLAPVALPFSHGELADFDAAVAPDEAFIVFSSFRPPAAVGKELIFIAFARDGGWTAPEPIQPLTNGLESRFSPDLATLYFTAEVPLPAGVGGKPPSRIFERPLSHRNP